MTTVVGVDEAGRGPIIGSLFITGVLINQKDEEKLKKEGVKDSKLLTHKKRILLEKKIRKIAKKIKIIQISPSEIDEAIDGNNSLNLNWLEAHKTVEIINELTPDIAIIDSPSPNLFKYKNYIFKLLEKKNVKLIVEHKADFKYAVVGAASIISKVKREEEIENLKKEYGEIGPGYMSNKITQNFFKENFEKHPEIFRKSWTPYKKAVHGKKQLKLNDF